jgi:hypothetical protein
MAGLFTIGCFQGFKSVGKIVQQAQPGKEKDYRQQCGFQFPVCCGQINSEYFAGGFRFSLLCAEKLSEECHRGLIAAHLVRKGHRLLRHL